MADQTTLTSAAVLEGILAGTSSLIVGAQGQPPGSRTPCPDFDVVHLTNHLIGFLRRFEAALADRPATEDPTAHIAGPDPAAEYALAAAGVVAGWRDGDPDGETVLTVGPMPRNLVYCVVLLESTVHGWDLAKATGQALPFTEEQVAAALEGSTRVVQPKYRGPGRNFGPEVVVAPDASPIDRLVAFTGRPPTWTPQLARAL